MIIKKYLHVNWSLWRTVWSRISIRTFWFQYECQNVFWDWLVRQIFSYIHEIHTYKVSHLCGSEDGWKNCTISWKLCRNQDECSLIVLSLFLVFWGFCIHRYWIKLSGVHALRLLQSWDQNLFLLSGLSLSICLQGWCLCFFSLFQLNKPRSRSWISRLFLFERIFNTFHGFQNF